MRSGTALVLLALLVLIISAAALQFAVLGP